MFRTLTPIREHRVNPNIRLLPSSLIFLVADYTRSVTRRIRRCYVATGRGGEFRVVNKYDRGRGALLAIVSGIRIRVPVMVTRAPQKADGRDRTCCRSATDRSRPIIDMLAQCTARINLYHIRRTLRRDHPSRYNNREVRIIFMSADPSLSISSYAPCARYLLAEYDVDNNRQIVRDGHIRKHTRVRAYIYIYCIASKNCVLNAFIESDAVI